MVRARQIGDNVKDVESKAQRGHNVTMAPMTTKPLRVDDVKIDDVSTKMPPLSTAGQEAMLQLATRLFPK